MNKSLSVILFLFLSFNAFSSESKAPFGLNWGATRTQLENKGIKFEKCNSNKTITTCNTKNPTKAISFGDVYTFIFDDSFGLQKIIMVSTKFTSDSTGYEGKKLYSKTKSSLSKKYGEPKSLELTGIKLFDESDEFYQCLRYDGCGYWASYWQPKAGGGVMIEIKGIQRGNGYLRMTYESKLWTSILDSYEADVSGTDENAL